MKNINITISQAIFASKFLQSCRLTPTARLVLLCLLSHYNSSTGALFPSLNLIGDECGCDRKQAIRAIKNLEENNIIKVLKGTNSKNTPQNYYQLELNFIQELINCFNSGKMTLYNISMRDKMTQFLGTFCSKDSGKMPQKHEIEHEIEHESNIFIPKTDFQQKNIHIFKILTEYQKEKLISLKPYDRQTFLDSIWLNNQKQIKNVIEQQERDKLIKTNTLPTASNEFKALSKKYNQQKIII